MVPIEHPDGHRAVDGPPRIQPRVEPADKTIAPIPSGPVSGIPHRLDLEELLGERLEGFVKRFRSRVNRRGDDQCWPWTGRIARDSGYGIVRFQIGGRIKVLVVHRPAFALAHGVVIPEGVLIRHSCGTRACVNPAHLYPGNYHGDLVSPEWAA